MEGEDPYDAYDSGTSTGGNMRNDGLYRRGDIRGRFGVILGKIRWRNLDIYFEFNHLLTNSNSCGTKGPFDL